MKFHKDGTLPQDGEVFVFGSNLAGIHGAGAAKVAMEKFGATWGRPFGHQGRSFAIPTKSMKIRTIPLASVKVFVDAFLEYADFFPNLEFFVTAIGCGLAGYKHEQIAPMFRGAPDNCSFPDVWEAWLDGND